MSIMLSLLSLLPPSCMVVPIRELVNKQFSHSSANTFHFTIAQFFSSIEMDINSNIILRRRSNLSSKANSRSSLIFSNTSFIPYHEYMELENNKSEDNIREPINSSQLFYKDNMDKDESISRVANTSSIYGKQHISNMALALKIVCHPGGKDSSNNSLNSSQQSTLNIQLPYDINQATD